MRRASLAQKLAVLAIPLLLLGAATAQAAQNFSGPGEGARIRVARIKGGLPANPTGVAGLGTCTAAEHADRQSLYNACMSQEYAKARKCLGIYQSDLCDSGAVSP